MSMFRSIVDTALDTLTTKGDLLVKTTAGFARQGVGANGLFLKADSTQTNGVTWSAAGGVSTTASKTGNYTLVNGTDQVVFGDASGGAFTFTLPTAVGNTGQIFTMIKITTSTASITIATTSAQTLGSMASGVAKLDFINENLTVVSDGTNWQVLNWSYPQKEYALTVTGSGWTSELATGRIYKSLDQQWRISFNVVGTMGSATAITLTMANITFKNFTGTNRIGISANNNSNGGAPDNMFCAGNASTFTVSFAAVTTIPLISANVPLEGKPGFSL